MTTGTSWDAATDRVIELTESGEIRWQPLQRIPSASQHGNSSELIPPAFVAVVQEKRLAVYEYRFQFYTDADEWHWETEVAIVFVNEDDHIEWEWPSPRRRRALLEAIRYQHSGAESFLDKLLAAGAGH
jgi:hypothetical protein